MARLQVAVAVLLPLLAQLILTAKLDDVTPEAPCRDCSVNACLDIAKSDGSCNGCICNGLLLPDCLPLSNCSAPCLPRPAPDGCTECYCAPICPPTPACPSKCQINMTDGCPHCTCPEKTTVPPVCETISCPSYCRDVTDHEGCPSCDCPPKDVTCPKLPTCPLGCIDNGEIPACLSCNCTLAKDLIARNEIPTGPVLDLPKSNKPTTGNAAVPENAAPTPSNSYQDNLNNLPLSQAAAPFTPVEASSQDNVPSHPQNPDENESAKNITNETPTNDRFSDPSVEYPIEPTSTGPEANGLPSASPASNGNTTSQDYPFGPSDSASSDAIFPIEEIEDLEFIPQEPNLLPTLPEELLPADDTRHANDYELVDPKQESPSYSDYGAIGSPSQPPIDNDYPSPSPSINGADYPSTNPLYNGADYPSSNPSNNGADYPSSNPSNNGADYPSSNPSNNGDNYASSNPSNNGADYPSPNPSSVSPDYPSSNPTNNVGVFPSNAGPQDTPDRLPLSPDYQSKQDFPSDLDFFDVAQQSSNSLQSPFDVPCGESSCQSGCVLCVQSDGCGRCLCGRQATICPAVPVCKVVCIVSRPDGCTDCSCPRESSLLDTPITRINTFQSGPLLSFSSGELSVDIPQLEDLDISEVVREVPGALKSLLSETLPIVQQLGASTAFDALLRIPEDLLGNSRFQNY